MAEHLCVFDSCAIVSTVPCNKAIYNHVRRKCVVGRTLVLPLFATSSPSPLYNQRSKVTELRFAETFPQAPAPYQLTTVFQPDFIEDL